MIYYKNILSSFYNMNELDEDIVESYNIIGKKIGAYKSNEIYRFPRPHCPGK